MAKQTTGKNTDSTLKKATTGNVLKALYTDSWFGFLDLALLGAAISALFIEIEYSFFLIFFFLTFGAFHWKFRAFALRSGFWMAVSIGIEIAEVFAGEAHPLLPTLPPPRQSKSALCPRSPL